MMNPKETAVIFIEFQNDFCHPDGKLYSVVKDEMARIGTIANAQRLLAGARQAGCKVIHCPFTLDKQWLSQHQVRGLLSGLADGDIFYPGSWGHEIIPELAPANGETVLEGKRTLSAFSHTNLADILRFAGIKNVVVCGFLTNVCAQATAWSAYDLGYQTRLVSDAAASGSPAIQQFVEEQIIPMFTSEGGLTTVDTILTEWR